MKHFLLIIAVASFALAGAVQKEQPKKAPAKKTTTTAKKTPTPTKKSTTTAKKSTTSTKKADPVAKKGTDKKSDSTKKTSPSNQKSSSATAKANTNKNVPAPSKTTAAATNPKSKPTPVKKDDKGDLEKALAIEDPDQKINALTKFLKDFPKSDLRTRAQESLTAARVAFGDANFEAGDPEYGLKLIRAAMREAPVPYPEKLFVEIISKVPSALYLHGERAAAIEAAAAIEKNSTSSVLQLLAVANFYLSTENGAEAKRVAEAAIKLDEKSSAAYQTLGWQTA